MGEERRHSLTIGESGKPREANAVGSQASPECAWCDPSQKCDPGEACGTDVRRIALLGNPNTGKTTLFNRLSGLRHKTSNFPGTTLEARVTRVKKGIEGGRDGDLIDLPGIYSLELDQLESRVCREVLAGTSAPRGEVLGEPECAVVVVDAANLARNLMLVGEVFRRRLPTVVVVNMIDVAERHGTRIDARALEGALGCSVVLTNAREGRGIDDVRMAIRHAKIPTPIKPVPPDADALRAWADEMNLHGARAARGPGTGTLSETVSDRVDRVLLHPVSGLAVFAVVMGALFYTIFALAQYPMDWLGSIFDWAKGLVHAGLGDGALANLLADGVVGGVGSVLIFLPQICLLFFLISLLEDTGYLSRGAFLMDRLLRPFGLPGHSFVPLLSSHACALPGIMATRAIPDRKERLATILVAPFMTCSARLPVYVLLTSLLFKDRPLLGAVAFIGCYFLGACAAVISALIARRTILKGKSRAMAMELPTYKRPALRTALVGTFDRARMFVKNAGTNILVICIVLWWLGAYPRIDRSPEAVQLEQQAEFIAKKGQKGRVLDVQDDPRSKPRLLLSADNRKEIVETLTKQAAAEADPQTQAFIAQQAGWAATVPLTIEEMKSEAQRIDSRSQKTHSFLGMLGRGVEPVFRPLGFDWQLTVGVLASFAAREVFVSTMNVVIAGQENGEDDAAKQHLMEQIQTAKRSDGVTPIFTPAASWSLLVFFVLAMQCLPTLAVTAKESGHIKWALLQLAWMSGVAYVAAMIVYQVMSS
jgi:ferrous iron transport protein B